MTSDTRKALLAFVGAIKSECERGHISDERGDVSLAATQVEQALKNEPIEPGAAWQCGPSVPPPVAPVRYQPPVIGDQPGGTAPTIIC